MKIISKTIIHSISIICRACSLSNQDTISLIKKEINGKEQILGRELNNCEIFESAMLILNDIIIHQGY